MKNGVLYGSFNPLHMSHVELIKKALGYFETLHIFIRSVPKADIVSYEVKKEWLEKLNEEIGADRLRIYPLEFPEGSIKENGQFDLVAIFKSTEEKAGVRLDGMISGGDKDVWREALEPAFPDREFIVIPRSETRSWAIRENLEEMKDSVPEYVYQTLKAL